MFLNFFYELKKNGIPVTIGEYLDLLQGTDEGLANFNVDDFYFLSRTVLIKHEQHLDKFDVIFGNYFKGTNQTIPDMEKNIPYAWLKRNMEKFLTEEEKAEIEALGGLEKLFDEFQKRLEEQKERHEGGNKWVGTGGTSPFGADGYNPEGFRVGQSGSRHRKAVKVWDKRMYRNLDDTRELNTRNFKLALKRLRVFVRDGLPEELDIDGTIDKTCKNAGMLDVEFIPSKKNKVKVLLFLDVGGSMDDFIEISSRLFSAARHEFKHLEHFYFHNCLYESVWKDSIRRHAEKIPTLEVFHKYNRDYKVIIVGDASMSPYEIVSKYGSVEHYNEESGMTWLNRLKAHFSDVVWINPVKPQHWKYTDSIQILQDWSEKRMFPMTVQGITKAMKSLKNSKLTYEP